LFLALRGMLPGNTCGRVGCGGQVGFTFPTQNTRTVLFTNYGGPVITKGVLVKRPWRCEKRRATHRGRAAKKKEMGNLSEDSKLKT